MENIEAAGSEFFHVRSTQSLRFDCDRIKRWGNRHKHPRRKVGEEKFKRCVSLLGRYLISENPKAQGIAKLQMVKPRQNHGGIDSLHYSYCPRAIRVVGVDGTKKTRVWVGIHLSPRSSEMISAPVVGRILSP